MKLSPKQCEALRLVAEGRFFPDLIAEDDGWYARWRPLTDDVSMPDEVRAGWVDEFVRSSAISRLTENAEDQRHQTLHDAWLMALRSRTGLVRWDAAQCAAFALDLRAWHGGAKEDVAARQSIRFTLEPDGEKFFVRCEAPTGRRALRALGAASFVFSALRNLRRAPDGRLAVELSRAEAESFLRVGGRDLAAAGYGLDGIDLSASIAASAELSEASAEPSEKPVKAKLVVKVDGEAVTVEEIRFLLEQKSTLVFFRDRWIEIDRNILREALRALEKCAEKTLSANEAVAFASGIGAFGRLELEEVRAHGWLRGLVNELRGARRAIDGTESSRLLPSADKVPGLAGDLRAYQRRGVAWMKFLTDHGFGALLADDMGLGKTIQTIAWILLSRGTSKKIERPFLVVAPLTLLGNWRHEFAKFAPTLKVYTHQGAGRQLEKGFARLTADADVVLTSYSLLVKDHAILRKTSWAGLVLDEAQTIKNPDTQVARAVRALGVRRRIALTGTPIENSVADVWSLEEYLNPTFLGERKSFVERFVKPLAQDERSTAGKRLKRALEPFILRRLKRDKEIAGELGEKREIKEYCPLSPAQRAAYENALEDFRVSERRQGDAFALITQLKLICDGAGKLERLAELLEGIFAAGESALVFTQYAKVGEKIRGFLSKRFARTFPYLHGGLEAKAREAEISRFKEDKAASAFILSLRAGGFGLNLTKATHVIHFDRWWNPAVENQATDRAHRIGQDRTVFVHAFITEGTLEEHVDEILERKARIAGTLVASGESFLRSLAPDEFNRVVSLSHSAIDTD